MGFDITVVGAVGIDTNIYMPGKDIDFNVEANFSENIDYIGQAGGYSARGFCKLDKDTAFIGYVGDDFLGQYIKIIMKEDGIDTSGIFIDPSGTRRSCNFMYKDGRRKNFYDGKGNMNLMPDLEQCRKILNTSKVAHFSIENWSRYLLQIAKDEGNIISCDIQDVVDVNDQYRKDYIEYADVLFFSSVNFIEPEPIMRKFAGDNTGKIIICGMGDKGCATFINGTFRRYDIVKLDIPVIDTNGAGDGLATGFLTSYLLDGYSVENSILRGQITARYTCGQKASTDNLITRDKLDAYFKTIEF
jgi:acarbose 7IV-phosphotransferase